MKQLFDREIHQLSKCSMVPEYYATKTMTISAAFVACVVQEQLMMMSPPPAVPPTRTPSMSNHLTGVLARFMFELSKSVFATASESSAPSHFTQATAGQQHHGSHRYLLMDAFHLSRENSAQVSWIISQAIDIDTPAIAFLVDAWKGHLTPCEVAGIADRASLSSYAITVRAAAELALSVLLYNYDQRQGAVFQCKKQNDALLEKACLLVEGAAESGRVYPEVLFAVARYWHRILLRHRKPPGPPLISLITLNDHPATHHAYPYSFPAPQYRLASQYFVSQPAFAVHSGHPSQFAAQPPPAYSKSATHANSMPPLASYPRVGQTGCEDTSAHQYSPAQLQYLSAAYRVGMLALELHNDRPQNKYGRNSQYGDDVKWLLRIAKKLGLQYLQQFCVCVVNSVESPFILYEVAVEAAHWLARTPFPLIEPLERQHSRTTLASLMQKCKQRFVHIVNQQLNHHTSNEYKDFASVVRSARSAFHLTPEGDVQFEGWLQSIERSKSCTRELWKQIDLALLNK